MSKVSELVENTNRYQNFIVFDPASIRVAENDILFIGKDVVSIFERAMDQTLEQEQDVKMKILLNKLQKIGNMIDLLKTYDNVIITKFFDRIWRRYSYVSHLGESFFSLNEFLTFFPEYEDKGDLIIANRLDMRRESSELLDDDESDDDDDENNDDELLGEDSIEKEDSIDEESEDE